MDKKKVKKLLNNLSKSIVRLKVVANKKPTNIEDVLERIKLLGVQVDDAKEEFGL